MAESFFGKLKTEMVHHQAFATRAEVISPRSIRAVVI
ncbi:IS3 family transposase [Streptosporangium sp. NPDC049046]